MKRTTRKSGKKAPVKVVRHDDHTGPLAYFAEQGQLLAPMLELIAKDLLHNLVTRGVDASCERLFVIDGSKVIRSAVEEVYGEQALVQRCRAHKLRNVAERLSEPMRAQAKSVQHAAYKLLDKGGIAKLRQQAKWLQPDYPVNRLKFTPTLIRFLSSTDIIENPRGRCVG